MKKLVCILLTLCMLMSAVSVLAVTPVLDSKTPMATIRIDGYEKSGNVNPGWYYYNPSDGAITFVAEGESAEGKGNLIKPEKVNADYAFTATTNGTVYHYQVLDVITVNGEKQYYIYCNDLYGKNPTASATNEFDPDVDGNIAKWLNTSFLNGGQGDGYVALDTNIKPYIAEHDWLVEANAKAPSGYPKTDYTAKCKIALLSITEYAKYSKKIGWGAYENGSLVSSGTHTMLRSPVGNSTNLRTLYQQTGCTANVAANYKTARIRPAFYVSENYFKNVKLDLSSAGSEVKKIISELNPSIYTPDEILALKGIFTISADGSEGTLSPAEWTNAANATIDENGVYNITNGKWIGRNLPEKVQGGTITVEADVNESIGTGFHIGLLYDGDVSPTYKYPFYIMGSSDVGQGGYYKEASQGKGASYKRLENKNYDLWCNHFNKPFRVKVTVNLDTGNSYVSISGKAAAGGNDLVKYSDGTTILPYINREKVFSKVAFYNASAQATKVDNIKITYDPNGNAYDTVKALDDNTLIVTFKDYVDTANVTASDVLISNNTAVSAVPNGNKLTVKFEKKLSADGGYIIVNNLKRADSQSTEYCVIGNGTAFNYELAEYTADVTINNPAFTSGSTVTATASVTAGNTSGKALELILAAYKGNRIIGISDIVRFNVTGGSADEQTETATLTLGDDADTIKAFLWDDNMLPAAFDAVSAQ